MARTPKPRRMDVGGSSLTSTPLVHRRSARVSELLQAPATSLHAPPKNTESIDPSPIVEASPNETQDTVLQPEETPTGTCPHPSTHYSASFSEWVRARGHGGHVGAHAHTRADVTRVCRSRMQRDAALMQPVYFNIHRQAARSLLQRLGSLTMRICGAHCGFAPGRRGLASCVCVCVCARQAVVEVEASAPPTR